MEYVLDGIAVTLTSTDRVMFPDVGVTKGDVLAYYKDIAPLMVPELRDRPLTLERFTKGVDAGGFYQKHAPKHYPPWIRRVELGAKTRVAYPICDSAAALVYLANQGGVAFHVWMSRAAAPMHPDLLVFDLDPPEGRFDLVRAAARMLRELFAPLDLPAFVKTTGSKGLHVVAPLDGRATFDAVAALGDRIAALLCRRAPDLFTQAFYKKDRKGRLFLDTMRNAPGATIIAPYSLRGRPGAPLSAPITWAEVDDAALRPDGITLRTIRARLDAVGDPWRDLRARAGSVAAASAALDALDASDALR